MIKNLSNIHSALFISAHPDDTEFGAGGLVQSFLECGIKVHLLILSNPTISLPNGFENDTFDIEQREAAATLGICDANVEMLDIPVRNFPKFRQQILDVFIKKRHEVNPDIIVTHSSSDIHQDHNTVAAECLRAFKNKTIIGYTHPWNSRAFIANTFFELSNKQLETKIRALKAFRSQASRRYSGPDVIRSLAVEAGIASGFQFAEKFEIVTMSIPQ